IHTGGTYVAVEVRHFRRHVRPDNKMAGNGIPRRVTRLEDRVDLAEGERAVGDEWCGQLKLSSSRCVFRHRDLAAREATTAYRHQPSLYPTDPESALERKPHVPGPVKIGGNEARVDQLVIGGEGGRVPCAGLERVECDAAGQDPGMHRVVD